MRLRCRGGAIHTPKSWIADRWIYRTHRDKAGLTEDTGLSRKVHVERAGLPAFSLAALRNSFNRLRIQGPSGNTALLSPHPHPQ